jgi:hypothetical protein
MDPALADAFQRTHPGTMVLPGGAEEKMSEVLEEFAEPLLRAADSPEGIRKAVLVAIVAWNYSLLDEQSKAEPDASHAALMADPTTRTIFEWLVKRKEQLYPHNRRIILDFKLVPTGTKFQFNVISTFAPG